MIMKADYSILLFVMVAVIMNHYAHSAPSATVSPSLSAVVAMSESLTGPRTKNIVSLNDLMTDINSLNSGTYMDDDINTVNLGRASYQPAMPLQTVNGLNSDSSAYYSDNDLSRALNEEIAVNAQKIGTLPEEPDYADTVSKGIEVANKFQMLRRLEDDLRNEQEVVTKSALLMRLLEDPLIDTLPIIYVEESFGDGNALTPASSEGEELLSPSNTISMTKRSRYYRRYPWKRHNRNRSTYEPELRYACTPSKEDVFKLLVNLHENRKGNVSKTVNFCNRKRPAKAIFTNIRFLG